MSEKHKLTITTHEEQAERDRAYWRSRTPEERLDAVEMLRLEAGKSSMTIHPDFEELFRLLEENRVDYRLPSALHRWGMA